MAQCFLHQIKSLNNIPEENKQDNFRIATKTKGQQNSAIPNEVSITCEVYLLDAF